VPAKAIVDLSIDWRGYDTGGERVDNPKWIAYRHAWLALQAPLADGNRVSIAFTDHVGWRAKRRGTVYRTAFEVGIGMRLAKRYRPGAAVVDRARTLPPIGGGLVLRSLQASADGAWIEATFRSASVKAWSLSLPGADGTLVALQWIYRAFAAGAARSSA
jgi:hypothetical protein